MGDDFAEGVSYDRTGVNVLRAFGGGTLTQAIVAGPWPTRRRRPDDNSFRVRIDGAFGVTAQLVPGALVRHPDRPDWGLGQVQSVIGDRITVAFENAGKKLVINSRVGLELVR